MKGAVHVSMCQCMRVCEFHPLVGQFDWLHTQFLYYGHQFRNPLEPIRFTYSLEQRFYCRGYAGLLLFPTIFPNYELNRRLCRRWLYEWEGKSKRWDSFGRGEEGKRGSCNHPAGNVLVYPKLQSDGWFSVWWPSWIFWANNPFWRWKQGFS